MTHKHIQTKANTNKLCETKHNQHSNSHPSRRRNNATLASASRLSRSLSFSTAGSCSDIYTGPTSCLIETLLVMFIPLIFSSFFMILFLSGITLSIVDQVISVLCTQIELSLLAITTRHAPLLLICYKCVLGLGRHKSVFHYIYLIIQ